MCAACGKRVGAGRAGSFTQWIFRQDICSCTNPKIVPLDPRLIPAVPLEQVEDDDTDEEMSIDDREFPIDRYKPVEILGKGVTGRVYLCRDRLLKKRVAVKVLNQVSQAELVAFQREAKATSRLNHPRIVRILDFGVSAARSPYMVMDFVAGTSLDQIRRQRKYLDWQTAFVLAVELCDALEYAHDNGILHRDLKPSNVLVENPDSTTPGVFLIDFGVAHVDNAAPASNQSNTVVGTPAYMSPDSITGLPYTAQSDIYALGCVMFECIAGRPPFITDTALDTLRMHAEVDPPALGEVNRDADIPPEIETIVSKCLEKKPSHRYHSATELKIALKRALRNSGRSVPQEPLKVLTPALEAPDAVPKNNFLFPIIAIGLVAIVALGAVGYPYFLAQSKPKVTKKKTKKQVVESIESTRPGPQLRLEELFQVDKKTREVISRGEIYDSDLRLIADLRVTRLTLNQQPNITDGACKYLMMMPLECFVVLKSAITDRGLKQLSRLETLKEFDLGRSQVTDAGILSLEHVRSAGFYKCNITDVAAKHLGVMPEIGMVNFTDSKVTDEGVAAFRNAPHLVTLFLAHCKITDKSLEHIATMSQMHILNLVATPVSLKGIWAIRNLPLQELEIGECPNLDDKCVEVIANSFKQLHHLSLDDTRISKRGFKHLRNMKNLTYLRVSRTVFDDSDLDTIESLPNLTVLDLSSTGVTAAVLPRLAKMPKLKILILNECKLISQAEMREYTGRFKIDSSKLFDFGPDVEFGDFLDDVH